MGGVSGKNEGDNKCRRWIRGKWGVDMITIKCIVHKIVKGVR